MLKPPHSRKKNIKNLSLPGPGLASPYLSPAPSSADSSRSDRSQSSDLPPCVIPPLPAEIDNENEGDDVASVEQFKAETLEMFKSGAMELVPEDFVVLEVLGRGVSGVVEKVRHVPTDTAMARKLIHLELRPAMRKQITTELKILYEVKSPYVVGFYGSCFSEADLSILMEYMDGGSLDTIYRRLGTIPEDMLARIAGDILKGLAYLQAQHRIIHRDIKPSNILMNTSGQVKMCDFGVSGQLVDSLANTFVGTRSYMAPERLMGSPYSVQSDIWSLGLSVMEMAVGRFPIPPDGSRRALAIFELLQYIVSDEPPTLPDTFSPEFRDFMAQCLAKDPTKRPTPSQLLTHPWVDKPTVTDEALAAWVQDALREPLRGSG